MASRPVQDQSRLGTPPTESFVACHTCILRAWRTEILTPPSLKLFNCEHEQIGLLTTSGFHTEGGGGGGQGFPLPSESFPPEF